jgi:DNA-binding SARP family transcriptional activator
LAHVERVISPVRALLAACPLAEPLAAVLVRALATTGRATEALDCFTAMHKQLIEQLGTDPGAETPSAGHVRSKLDTLEAQRG